MNIRKIYLASPRGFCAGVTRAIKIVDLVLKKHGSPIYVRHQIVHNRHVIQNFEKKGVIFVENLDDVPQKSVVIFSAHGSPPQLYKQAKKRKLILYDATCPLVTKVHLEAKRYASEGYFIIYIGHKGHAEAVGVLGEVKLNSIALVEKIDDIKKLKLAQKEKIIVLTQTTLSFDDTSQLIQSIKREFNKAVLPPAFDICFSTQNRQNAVKKLAKKAQAILVVGSKESSNSNKLRQVAINAGVPAYLIDDETEIEEKWFKNISTVGITAGASAPDYIVNDVVNFFKKNNAQVKELEVLKENINFPIPKNL